MRRRPDLAIERGNNSTESINYTRRISKAFFLHDSLRLTPPPHSSPPSPEMNEVQQYLSGCQREQKMAELTKSEMSSFPSDAAMYRSVGKMFMKATRDEIESYHDSQSATLQKKEKQYNDKLEYLKKRANSQMVNYKELRGGR